MKNIFKDVYKLMAKYRLYLEGITEVAEQFEADGTIIGAEQIIHDVTIDGFI